MDQERDEERGEEPDLRVVQKQVEGDQHLDGKDEDLEPLEKQEPVLWPVDVEERDQRQRQEEIRDGVELVDPLADALVRYEYPRYTGVAQRPSEKRSATKVKQMLADSPAS